MPSGKTPIYVDSKNRRRRGDAEGPSMGAPDQLSQLIERVTALENLVKQLSAALQGMIVTGPGFSGSGPKGIMFDPTAINTGDGETTPTLVNFEFCDGSSGDVAVQNYIPA